MPKVAKSFEITTDDRGRPTDLLIDGTEFPWFITKEGPKVEKVAGFDGLKTVTVSILVDERSGS